MDIKPQPQILHAHRLGNPNATRSRPIKVTFAKPDERQSVWKSKKGLKGTNVFINEHFTREVKYARRALFPYMQLARDRGENAYISFDRLTIGTKVYSVDKLCELPEYLKNVFTPSDGKTTLFFTKNSHFSNFYSSPMVVDGREYSSNEQFYLSKQAVSSDRKDVHDLIMSTTNPHEMKQHSKSYYPPQTWAENCDDVMKIGLVAKFTQNPALKQLLMDTKHQTLAEASAHDQYWGTGVSITHKNAFDISKWTGQNVMGKLLMEPRDDFYN
jgi:hypothetical protein